MDSKYLLLWIFFICSCSPKLYKPSTIQGHYRQVGNGRAELIFNKDKFHFVDPAGGDLAIYYCCDTITKGDYKIAKDLIELTTPNINSPIIYSEVTESREIISDSILLELRSPLENIQQKEKSLSRDIHYKIIIESENSLFFNKYMSVSFMSNYIKLPKPKNVVITKITLLIFPAYNFRGNDIGIKWVASSPYIVKDSGANYFVIAAPTLSFESFTYRRLKKDFVRIVNKNKLEWDGTYYIKN